MGPNQGRNAEDAESRPKIGRRGQPLQDREPMPGAEDAESRPKIGRRGQPFLFAYNTGQFRCALSNHFGWRHSIQKQMIAKNVPMTKIPNKGTTFLTLLLDFDELSS